MRHIFTFPGTKMCVFVQMPHSIGSRSKKMSFLFCRRAETVAEELVTLCLMSEAISVTSLVRKFLHYVASS